MTPILVTGAAGFIGFHLSLRYLEAGRPVVGFDNLNDYYDVNLKRARLDVLKRSPAFQFVQADLADAGALNRLFEQHRFEVVVNLAAQAGVRYSLTNPQAYVESNLVGFVNILEACRHLGTRHLLYASSSSVYGGVTKMPFSVHQNVDHPLSVYAATKKSNELLAHAYSHLFRLPTTGLRFFTAYGPWGRPDMALFKFTRAILEGKPVPLHNFGRMRRDFTYIDDIVEGIVGLLDHLPKAVQGDASDDPASSHVAAHRIFNIGSDRPIELQYFLAVLETALGRKARIEFLGPQPGEVETTWADISALNAAIGYRPRTPFERGVETFVNWYRDYFR